MNNKQVDVGTLLGSISEMLQQNQDKLNEVDSGPSGGTHGDRIAQAFRTAADAARESGTEDAGEQLSLAAQAMRENGQGRAVGYYADGLQEAASQFGGKSGISTSDLAPFLQSFLGGVRQNNPAQPGQGTMIDALLPAVTSLMGANKRGADPSQSAMDALGSAINGARGTVGIRGNHVDAGAASATGVLGGIFKALLPGILGAVMGKLTSGGRQSQTQNEPQGGGGIGDLIGQLTGGGGGGSQSGQGGGGGGGLGDLIGQITGGGGSQSGQGGGGLGDLIGNVMGGGNRDQGQQTQQEDQGKPGWWPF